MLAFIIDNPARIHHTEQHVTIVFTIPAPVRPEIVLAILILITVEYKLMTTHGLRLSTKHHGTCLRHLIIDNINPSLIVIFEIIEHIYIIIAKYILYSNQHV